MANEIQIAVGTAGLTVYFIVRNNIGQVWRVDTHVWEAYTTANYLNYATTMTQQGSASGFYAGTFPTQITAGIYSIVAKNQLSGSAAETDPNLGSGDYQWNGTTTFPLSDVVTSGQFASIAPLRIGRSQQLSNFTFALVSSADHVTSFTSGVCSGQISKDGAGFIALQSGVFTEIGNGFYSTTLTSGDLACNTAGLLITCNGISGGSSDPRRFSLVTQRISGF